MAVREIVSPLAADIDAATQPLQGIGALAAELASEGVSVSRLFAGTGVQAAQLEDSEARISHRQRLAIYRNARRLATRDDIGLLAGARQRLSDFGIYGFAMVSSATFGDALSFSLQHLVMAGPVLQVRFHVDKDVAILRSEGVESLGDLLPFVSEFWRSSLATLFGVILEAPFPFKRMSFMYPAPVHWRSYERRFNCPIEFDSASMEWQFDADVLNRPCPNANPITAQICQKFCERALAEVPGEAELPRRIRVVCLNRPSNMPAADEAARLMNVSLRTLHRRLSESGTSYQAIIDSVRSSVASELLTNTHLSVERIAERVGFSNAITFRNAFKKWTGLSPSQLRSVSSN